MRFSFLLIVIVACLSAARAQDTIIKKNGDIMLTKITEIGTDEVKFRIFGQQDGPIISMKRSEIKKATVAGQTVINVKGDAAAISEDVIVKKSGETIKVKVMEIGTDEIKFKLYNDPDGPTISMLKSEIKTMKVEGQTVIDVKSGLTEDIITKRDGSVIKAKIAEMGATEVKYKLYSTPDGPMMALKKNEIDNVKIDGQVVYEYKPDPMSVSNNSIQDRTSTWKFYFFSPLFNHIDIGYEWMNKPGFNWDVALGIIGPGVSSTTNRKGQGVFLRGGPKFLLGSSSDVVTEDTKDRYAHPLRGRYIKVEMILNAFSSTNQIDTGGYYYPYTSTLGKLSYTKKYQSLTLDIQYGRQYIFGNAMTLAWFIGTGYSFESKSSTLPSKYKNYDFDLARYSHSYFGQNFPMILTWGITIGYIMPAPKWMLSKKVMVASKPKPPTRHSMTE